ncbi:hypothetical protein [Pseudoclavibacter soli]|uniref:hypothetical protein n=1 Tax=Pseudoclavibacter soli TaxID=452623 RepID=UPI0004885B57|nr:hypothetical protein [Pseudoclavibacter soli]
MSSFDPAQHPRGNASTGQAGQFATKQQAPAEVSLYPQLATTRRIPKANDVVVWEGEPCRLIGRSAETAAEVSVRTGSPESPAQSGQRGELERAGLVPPRAARTDGWHAQSKVDGRLLRLPAGKHDVVVDEPPPLFDL